jgi:hypothetical protein
MKPKEQCKDTTTLPTDELLYLILGDEHSGNERRVVPNCVGSILHIKLKSSLLYKVVYDEEADSYTVWWYDAWYYDTNRRRKMKEYLNKLQVEEWLLKANVKDLAYCIQKSAKVGQEVAEAMAYSMIKKPNGMVVIKEIFGLNKLKEKVEELD